MLAAIRSISDKPIHYIVDTQADEDHTGGNEALAEAGPTRPDRAPLSSGLGGNTGGITSIIAHENVQKRMRTPVAGGGAARPVAAWPVDTFINDETDVFFNDEAVQVLHQPNAHADGDSIVFFRRSDVIAAGDVFSTVSYPVFDKAQGGSINGVIAALNRIIKLAVATGNMEGGTMIVPGHGRAQRQDGRRRVPEHGHHRPRSRPGARRPGQDARPGAGDAADARLRRAVRRRDRACIAARVRDGGVRQPARNTCEGDPDDVGMGAFTSIVALALVAGLATTLAGQGRGAPRTCRAANREDRARHRSRQVARGQPRGRLAGS